MNILNGEKIGTHGFEQKPSEAMEPPTNDPLIPKKAI
jgi:hypothetical protein